MRTISACISLTAAILIGATATALAAPAVTTANVNMRQGPATHYAVIVTLPAQTSVEVEGCATEWCKVDYNGTGGWVSEPYLQGLSNPPVIALPPPLIVQPTLVIGRPHRHHFGRRPHVRPPVHHPRPPAVRPPHHRPPHHRPPHHRPPGGRPPGHRPPEGGRPPHHRPPGGRPKPRPQ